MKAIKPLSLGLLHRPYRIGDEYRFVVSALGFFRLGTQNERFLIDNLQWPLVAKALPAGQMLDEVMPKPAGEVLLAGSAHAPGGEPVKTMTVSMQLGKLQKSLRIVGKRTWAYGLLPWYRISAPAPFSSMPIDYAHAFGGPGLKANPAGMGYSGNPFAAFWGSNTGVLPNIELPGRPAIRHWRRYAPAGFGAIPLSWTPRMTLLRAMPRPDEKQLTATSPLPGLAARVDRSLFQMAPTDQQLPGDVGSGEPYRLTGMHPQQPVIEGQLPALAARAFIQRRGSDAAEEVPLQCDTVWFFPDLLLGVMIWHGEAAISDSLAQDVQTVMVAYERAGSPKPLAHYQQALARRTNPATAGHDAFNESQLAAEYSPAEQARRASAQAMVQATETARQQAVLDEHTADFWASSGLQPPPGYVPPIIPAPPLPLPNPLQIRERDFDVGALIDAARAVGNTLQQQAAVQLADARLQLGKLAPPPSPRYANNNSRRWRGPAWLLVICSRYRPRCRHSCNRCWRRPDSINPASPACSRWQSRPHGLIAQPPSCRHCSGKPGKWRRKATRQLRRSIRWWPPGWASNWRCGTLAGPCWRAAMWLAPGWPAWTSVVRIYARSCSITPI